MHELRSAGSSVLHLFRQLVIAQPITDEGLTLFEAVGAIHNPHSEDIYTSIRDVYTHRDCLDGEHIASLHQLIHTFDKPSANDLLTAMIHPWLSRGIKKCIWSCRDAVKEHIEKGLDWMPLALELHTFCIDVRESRHVFPFVSVVTKALLRSWLSTEQMDMIREILEVSQKQASKNSTVSLKTGAIAAKPKTSDSKVNATQQLQQSMRHPLEKIIEEFYISRCLDSGKIAPETQDTIETLLHIWKSTVGNTIDSDRRSLAILVSKLIDAGATLRNECLKEIATGNRLLRPHSFIKHLLAIMQQYETEPAPATIAMTRLLTDRQAWTKCWKTLLLTWIARDGKPGLAKGSGFLDYTLQSMRAAEWLAFMRTLETLFNGYLEDTSCEVPAILQPDLLAWKSRASRFVDTLTKLEERLSGGRVDASVQCILSRGGGGGGGGGASSELFVSILECLEEVQGDLRESIMYLAVEKLSAASKNVEVVKNCVCIVKQATPQEQELFKKIWSVCSGNSEIPEGTECSARARPEKSAVVAAHTRKKDLSSAVREVIIAGYLQDDNIRPNVKMAIESIALLFDLEIYKTDIPAAKLDEAIAFWAPIEAEILQEAERLDSLIKQLKQVDPQGTLRFLEEHKIPDHDPLDEELRNLPLDAIDAVEKLGDNTVEISFSLAVLSPLHRTVMGVPKEATTVFLFLETDYKGREPQQYSLRLDCTMSTVDIKRQPAPNLFLWHLKRLVHTQLQAGRVGIAELHGTVKARLENMRQACVSCGRLQTSRGIQLLRPGPCDQKACQDTWNSLPIDLRIPDIKTNPLATDVLLAGLYAAALTSRPELLPGAKMAWIDVKKIANLLPALKVVKPSVNLSFLLPSYNIQAERLLSWSHSLTPGILALATSTTKIPNLPLDTVQFILSSTHPHAETAFTAKLPPKDPKTTILFHGTSLDRLPGILAHGLKNCSGTALQRVGAAHGHGIYLAEEPDLAFSYTAAPPHVGWRNSGVGGMRLLLGCEVVGKGNVVVEGIHVMKEEGDVVVRYVFLEPAQDPIRRSNALDSVISKRGGVKRKLEVLHDEEQKIHRAAKARLKHLQDLYEIQSLVDVRYDEWSRTRLSRLLVDCLLREGYTESATHLAQSKGITELVDVEPFIACHKIERSLKEGMTTSLALEWCKEHGKELKKGANMLEFELRLQQWRMACMGLALGVGAAR
ncbi:hypothetical protein LEMA_P100190.1 [Plenodomus lingam JN3]|uniref:Caspase family p10 domain-containing protein n=1 Tax=Leptosphaeria maculans (strain JN3 / isolate v23.1.3 / race Av1-4-5-6-7-8) TaxID=985895 RepID=E5A028_LEPMJ|nr:hypothetical protein LEMA_P100190.1 [Plenodomus lingam JN3]CBX96888.1 hypothetical protein LEMA_P100190.1 [Plenodomus lingam JN3]